MTSDPDLARDLSQARLNLLRLASKPLRDGLSVASAEAAAPHLRAMLKCRAVAVATQEGVLLAWEGDAGHHLDWVIEAAFEAGHTGRQQVRTQWEMHCGQMDCPVRAVIVSPLEVDGNVVGSLAAISEDSARTGSLRAVSDLARFVSAQLELHGLAPPTGIDGFLADERTDAWRPPSHVAQRVVTVALRVLPAGSRPRYTEELRDELGMLGRWAQLRYAFRFATGSWQLRRSLCHRAATPARET